MDPDPARSLRGILDEALADARTRGARAERELAQLRADRGADTADDEHDPEGATLSGEWAIKESLHAAVLREEADVREAIARWDAGTYGVCAHCGRSILPARLEARPTATLCISCASRPGT